MYQISRRRVSGIGLARVGLRRNIALTLGYDDRNDGFDRKNFSRNCQNRSRAYKHGKINKKRVEIPPWRSLNPVLEASGE